MAIRSIGSIVFFFSMETFRAPWISVLLLAVVLFYSSPSIVFCRQSPDSGTGQLQTYIIQVEKPAQVLDEQSLHLWYRSFLPDQPDADDSDRLLHSYTEVFSGFAARLTEEELEKLSSKDGFLRAFPNRVVALHTTRSPEFLGLRVGRGLWKKSSLGKGVIIGVLDTGITPGHPSFHDNGLPPPPAKWKGYCHFPRGCNNKLIGAKNMIDPSKPPTDIQGHGTHTSSTAAGNFVRNANIGGLASGIASGTAPLAHLAMYQVCSETGCSIDVVLAGMDAAVKDGVDVVSVSLGGNPTPYDQDPIAIGAFGAAEKGIFVSFSAGNSGPAASTITNDAPWMLTVAATTIDRNLRATVKLGSGSVLIGGSLDQPPSFPKRSFPVNAPVVCDSLSREDAQGKVVVCPIVEEPKAIASTVKAAGGVASVFIEQSDFDTLFDYKTNFPSAMISQKDGDTISSYVTSSKNPTASILFNGTVLGVSPAPLVGFFSSRGPSVLAPGIIKPDISGPGVNILAGWITEEGGNGFEIVSGTSMSTPHLSGIAALIKSVHPNWSPAAIKSAIITTSEYKDRDRKPIQNEVHKPASFFELGAGHVNPSKAADPGLVYDLSMDDYIAYICGKFEGPGAKSIIRDRTVRCSEIKNITEAELNYPSILLAAQSVAWATTHRTVTNVGPARSSYEVKVRLPKSVSVTVEPRTLVFSKVNEKQSFKVSAKWTGGGAPAGSSFVEGNLRWVSDTHVVRSPIVISAITASK